MKVNFNPSSEHIQDTKDWLASEYETTGAGFFTNWAFILESIDSKQFAVFIDEEKPIGFTTWLDGEIHRDINYFALEPSKRNLGFGSAFYVELEKVTRTKGFKTIKLFCSPEDSKFFWQKMGFTEFPNGIRSTTELTYYKHLVDVNIPTSKSSNGWKLELWNKEPFQIKDETPQWTWDLKTISNDKPLLHPYDHDWKARVSKNNQVIQDCKIKRLNTAGTRAEYIPFLYIDDAESLLQ